MIIPALLIFILGRLIPTWIFKENKLELNSQPCCRYVLTKMSGSATSFLFAFIIVIILTLSGHEKYLPNRNAIYGIKCSQLAKDVGFRDGDKIISINNKEIERFSDIIKMIVLEDGPVYIKIQRDENEDTIMISNKDKLDIMRLTTNDYIVPKVQPDSVLNTKYEQLTFIESRLGLKRAFNTYGLMFKQINIIFAPRHNQFENIGGFVTISSRDLKSISTIFAMCLILIGLVNLLPLPGLDFGNAVIALAEKIRKRRYNKRIMTVLKTVCIIAAIILMIALY
jgi:membrane-associated protease RseP (regulator of RpoE activity)